MDRIIVSRHGESVATAEGLQNGDPAADEGLTTTGQDQAGELGRQVASEVFDLCVTSQFPRVQQTAALALSGRELPCTVDPDLNDLRYGQFEGQPKERYLAWARSNSPAAPIPGGESRVQVVARLCRAFTAVLARPGQCALVVTHELLIDDLLRATRGEIPSQVAGDVPFAMPYRLPATEVERAVDVLQQWLAGGADGLPSFGPRS